MTRRRGSRSTIRGRHLSPGSGRERGDHRAQESVHGLGGREDFSDIRVEYDGDRAVSELVRKWVRAGARIVEPVLGAKVPGQPSRRLTG
jgi:hypothetical protein